MTASFLCYATAEKYMREHQEKRTAFYVTEQGRDRPVLVEAIAIPDTFEGSIELTSQIVEQDAYNKFYSVIRLTKQDRVPIYENRLYVQSKTSDAIRCTIFDHITKIPVAGTPTDRCVLFVRQTLDLTTMLLNMDPMKKTEYGNYEKTQEYLDSLDTKDILRRASDLSAEVIAADAFFRFWGVT